MRCKNGDFEIVGPSSEDNIKELYAKYKICGIDKCVTAEEKHHIMQFKEYCPDACKATCDAKDPDGFLVGFVGPECSFKSECCAHLALLSCATEEFCAKIKANNTRCAAFILEAIIAESAAFTKCGKEIWDACWPNRWKVKDVPRCADKPKPQ